MKALIVGASGFVGTALLEEFGADSVGTYFSHAVAGLVPLDLRDARAVDRLLDELRPGVVVQPAAQPHVDWCEEHPDESYAINVQGTRNLARAAERIGARYLFFSTDYVFDGESGPYPEDAPTRPLNVYGEHKLEAEKFIRETTTRFLIIRVCNVYGYEAQGKNFVMALLARGRKGDRMNLPSDQWGVPTYGPNLAAAVGELAESSVTGILNVVGPDYLDRVTFARMACQIFDLDPHFLCPMTTAELGQRAVRPLRGGLDSTRAQRLLRTPLLGASEGLRLMRERLRHEGLL